MRRRVRVLAGILAVGIAAAMLGATPALAQYREFSGQILKINKKNLIVDNRMGDKVKFVRAEETEVSGEGKTSWDDLAQKDWVTVSWKFIDKPRKAYKVNVNPPPPDDEEDL